MKALERARIVTPEGQSGELSLHGDYLFRYGIGVDADTQISLTMPVRDATYTSKALHPIFQMNLPEGYVLEQLRNRLAKSTPVNPMLLMALTGSGSPIYLSANRQLFVMRRFDRDEQQNPLGFEDMAVLTGLGTEEKYNSSYEKIARALRLFCAPEHLQASLEQLFDMVALSCMVGNGDGHLKNFGVLYQHPLGDDARLAPAYDIVNTTAYLPDDSLALTLNGSKSLFHSRLRLLDFARTCEVASPEARLKHLIAAVDEALEVNQAMAEEAPEVFQAIRYANGLFRQSFN